MRQQFWMMVLSTAAIAAGCGEDDNTATTDTLAGTDTQTVGTDGTDGTEGTDGTDLPADCDVEPTFSSIHEKYFQTSCALSASCHQGSPGAGGLSLDLDVAYDQLVGAGAIFAPDDIRVIPGDPDGSFLIRKLEGTLSPGEGVMMPQGLSEPLDPECRIAAIRAWIAAGAPNN